MATAALREVCLGSWCAVVPHPRNAFRPYALRHPFLVFVSALLVAAKAGVLLLLALAPEVASLSTVSASFLVSQTNVARAAEGLSALRSHPLLAASAKKKAEDMLAHDYFEHTSPTGVSPWTWIDAAGYDYVYAGENLAIDFTTGEGVHAAWMRSPGHRKNILSEKYRDIGIAVVTGEFEGRTTTVVVQHFGSLTSAPAATPKPTPAPAPTNAPRPAAVPQPTAPPPPVPTATPETVPAPVILEPEEGQLLPSGASTVRGTSATNSRVILSLDDTSVGSYGAPNGTFAGTFTPPIEEERDAVLTARASRDGRQGQDSPPRHVRLDTRGPLIAEDSAVLLPEPGQIGVLRVAVPITGSPRSVTAMIAGREIPLTLHGSVASARIEARMASEPVELSARDEHGNTRQATVRPIATFRQTPRTAGESDARERVLRLTETLRSTVSVLLLVVALLLAVNILVYVRIQHADLIAHAAFVLILGTLLYFVT
jgi:cysteine-rich secretory family protein